MSDLCQRLYLNDNFKMWLFVQNLEPTFYAIRGGPFDVWSGWLIWYWHEFFNPYMHKDLFVLETCMHDTFFSV